MSVHSSRIVTQLLLSCQYPFPGIETGLRKMNTQAIRDAEGYLVNPEDWTDSIAIELAKEEGIELNDHHWQILRFMNKYYGENNIAPDVRHVIAYLAAVSQSDKKEAKKLVFELFPYGYVKQACKISGMKRPRAWSTG
jgi:tRNA 2-thiouridine synthesizing protein E